MGTVCLWCIICLGTTLLPRTFWLGMFSQTQKAAAMLSLWPRIPQRNSDNSETEGEEGSDKTNFEEQHADWTLGNTSQTVSAQSSIGERIKPNSCNKEQTGNKEAKKNRNQKKEEICELVSDVSKAGGDRALLIRYPQSEDINYSEYSRIFLWKRTMKEPSVGGLGQAVFMYMPGINLSSNKVVLREIFFIIEDVMWEVISVDLWKKSRKTFALLCAQLVSWQSCKKRLYVKLNLQQICSYHPPFLQKEQG